MVCLPRKLHITITALFVTVALVVAFMLLTNSAPQQNPILNVDDIIFMYGVGAKNELNTFEDTYTKDLIIGNTTTTSLFYLKKN